MSQTERKLIRASEIREVAQAIWARRQEEYLLEQAERIELASAAARDSRLDYLLQWCEREGVEYLPDKEGYLPIPGGWLIEASSRYGDLMVRVLGPCPYCHEIVDPQNGRAWHRDLAGIGSIIESFKINPADHECEGWYPVPPTTDPSVVPTATTRLADALMDVLLERYPDRFLQP